MNNRTLIKDMYREELNKDVYSDSCFGNTNASYSDEYVQWLEITLSNYVNKESSISSFEEVCKTNNLDSESGRSSHPTDCYQEGLRNMYNALINMYKVWNEPKKK